MEKLDKVDFLRGLAILGVFSYHASIAVFGVYFIPVKGLLIDYHTYPLKRLVVNFLPSACGSLGVELFLLISGFLIHSGYLRSGFEPVKFFNKRFWRIYPPYLLALVLFTATLGLPGGLPNLIAHLTMTYNLQDAYFFGTNPSFWSLALEVQLYLIYPLFLFLRNKTGRGAYVIVLLIHLAFILYEVAIGSVPLWLGNNVFKFWIVWVAGAFVAEYYHQNKRLSRIGFGPLVLMAVLLMASRAVYFPLSLLGWTAFFCLLLDWFLHLQLKTTRFFKMFFRFIVTVGLYSYSIYLLHQPFLQKGIGLLSLNFRSTPLVVLACLLYFAVVYVVSYVMYERVELPSIRYGRTFYYRLKKERGTK